MVNLVIRDATRADLADLRDLFLQARRETFHWTDPLLFRLQDFDIQTEGETVMLAEVDGVIAGFVSWWTPENFVHHLYVGKGYMRRGIGGSLLQGALSRMDGPARLKCSQRNESALAFYMALGWRVLEPGHSEDGPFFLMAFPGGDEDAGILEIVCLAAPTQLDCPRSPKSPLVKMQKRPCGVCDEWSSAIRYKDMPEESIHASDIEAHPWDCRAGRAGRYSLDHAARCKACIRAGACDCGVADTRVAQA